MLINKKELNYKDGLWIESLFESSNVLKTEYKVSDNKLYIYFDNGLVYSYTNISKSLHEDFENAESQGKFFINNIKKYPHKYPYSREFKITEGEINGLKDLIKEQKEKLKDEETNS